MLTTTYPRTDVQRLDQGITDALTHRMAPGSHPITELGRRHQAQSLLEMGREFLTVRGVNTDGMSRFELASELLFGRAAGMMGGSDFSSLLANVANKRLRQAYEENPGTYVRWARRAPDLPDFKPTSVVQLSAVPDLLQLNEHGEFSYASMSDGAITYQLATYGRTVAFTRQAIVNDDLRGINRVIEGFAAAARRLENRLVYAQLTANANMPDGNALFSTAHGNNGTGGGSALQLTALQTARAAMRTQMGLQSEELNLSPAYLIVPAALESTAYQLTSAAMLAATYDKVNEFRNGGRTALEPIVEPVLDGVNTAGWYLAANSGQVDTVEYCFLEGADGPVVEARPNFDTDGIAIKARHDFAAKVIDFRGLYRGVGS